VPTVLLLHYKLLQHAPVPTVLLLHYYYAQLQHAAVLTVPLLHYYDDKYNTLPRLLCYYYSTTTTTAKRFRAHRAYTTLLLLQLQCTAMPAVMLFVLTLH